MCGIAGYVLTQSYESTSERILRMTRSIAHRGPDDEGLTLFCSPSGESIDLATQDTVRGLSELSISREIEAFRHDIAFGHRRFSIIDVSPAGHQPFWSPDRQVCVAFNGEIYNYLELRQALEKEGYTFNTQSDTEVLVTAYQHWGTECFQRFNGFWAISLYDARKNAVLLARDRLGVAPLYVAKTEEGLFWASEIKSILTNRTTFSINEQAVGDFVLRGWRDLFNTTFYNGINTFPKASFAWIQADGHYEAQSYWQLPTHRLTEAELSIPDAIAQSRFLLTDALRLRLRADVPVGLTLSGGLDSSALVAFAAQSGIPLNTFTVSFPGTSVDEEPFARSVAKTYPNLVNYQVIHPQDTDLLESADHYIALLDEPFHSPNLFTDQGIVRTMANAGIRVCITGAAGDETLAGYGGEYHGRYLRELLSTGQFRRGFKEFIQFSEHQTWKDYCQTLYRTLPSSAKLLSNLNQSIPAHLDPFICPNPFLQQSGAADELRQRLLDNMGNWLMNYWLRSGNTSYMEVPIEARAPYLDYRFVEFAFTLPPSYLIRDGWLKWILRESVKDLLPPDVVYRKKKAGFPFPLSSWLLQSKAKLFLLLDGLDCPYLNLVHLKSESYDTLAHLYPAYLWRLISLALWWKKCVQGESLL
jgi:asparagine synthase (glutamine-hydrolysing)